METMSVPAMRNLMIFIAWAVGSALLLGTVLPLMRAGVRHSDPSAAAGLFALVFTAGACGVAALKGTLPAIWSVDNATLVRLLACGLLTAFLWLCLFTSLTGGQAGRVAPIINLSGVLLLVARHFLLGTPLGLWRLCCIVLILLGTVLIESRSGATRRGMLFMVYAALALIAYAGLEFVYERSLAALDPALFDVSRGAVASISLWIFVFLRGKQRKLAEMPVGAYVCIPLAALGCAASAAFTYFASLHGELSTLAPVTILSFAAAMLLSRIALKERRPGAAAFGTLLVLLGMFAIQMGW